VLLLFSPVTLNYDLAVTLIYELDLAKCLRQRSDSEPH